MRRIQSNEHQKTSGDGKKVDEEGRKVGDSVHGSLQQLSWSNYLKIYPRPVYCIVSIL